MWLSEKDQRVEPESLSTTATQMVVLLVWQQPGRKGQVAPLLIQKHLDPCLHKQRTQKWLKPCVCCLEFHHRSHKHKAMEGVVIQSNESDTGGRSEMVAAAGWTGRQGFGILNKGKESLSLSSREEAFSC